MGAEAIFAVVAHPKTVQLRPAFVLTLSAASAVGTIGCSEPEPISRNPPADLVVPTTTASTSAAQEATASTPTTLPSTSASSDAVRNSTASKREHTLAKNPNIDGKPVRLAPDKTCFVYLPFPPLKPNEQRPPGTEPPRKKVACPPGMDADPAYLACFYGTIFAAEGEPPDCECSVGGNPPPLPTTVPCPR